MWPTMPMRFAVNVSATISLAVAAANGPTVACIAAALLIVGLAVTYAVALGPAVAVTAQVSGVGES